MILEEIEVENFFSHRHSKICFTDSRLWLINGENGAGKSALFDALECDLYGKHRGGNQNLALLIKQGAQRAKITVVFSHHGVRYRVIREIDYKSGNRSGRLATWDATANDWVPENVGDGAGAVWSWLKPKIPNHDLFCLAIFLRQNDTAHFLAGTAGDRSRRFAALINLDRYTELSRKAFELAQEAKLDREVARQRSNDLGNLSDEALQQLADLLRSMTDELSLAQAAYEQAQQTARNAEIWARLQTRHHDYERLAQGFKALLSAEETIRAAARRVTAWDQAVPLLEQYWGHCTESEERGAKAATKRDEAKQAERERQNVENDLVATQQRLEVIERDELLAARNQAEAVQARLLCLEHERKIAVAQEEQSAAKREVERLGGADETYVNWQNRSRALPHLQHLADARAGLEEAECAVPLAQAAFDEAAQKADEAHERLDAIGRDLEEAAQRRAQAAQRIARLQADIARLEGQIASHGRLTGEESECPVCTQALDESTFRHVQEKLKDECADLEQIRAELDTEAELALKRIDDLIEQLKGDEFKQRKKSKAADEPKGKARDELAEANKQLEMACMNLVHAQETLLAENPSLAEQITEIDRAWVAGERGTIAAALPRVRAAAQQLEKVQEAYRNARAKVVTLHEQHDPGADPLADYRTNREIATLVQEATTEAKKCQRLVKKLEEERADLGRQATAQAETRAGLAERASQAQQQAEQLDAEARAASRKANQWYNRLRSEWSACLEDRAAYEAEDQIIETLRPDAGRLAELDRARGRLQGVEEELQRIAAEEVQISLDHRLPVKQAKQAETEAGQYLADMRNRQRDAATAINTLHQKRQTNEAFRQEMERADRDETTFRQLAELLKSGGPIQKAIAEQEQRRIAIEANKILGLLNDQLRIHIDHARHGDDTQDLTIIDTSDIAGGDANAPNRSRRYFEFLSGGEQFRVALALALALHRLVAGDATGTLIVNEGFGALDSNRRDHLALQMAKTSQGILSRNLVHSVIICSHATEVQHHFRDSCWIVEKLAGTASVRRAGDERS
jgi:DNA repair protein SbcC/Rad50